MELSISELLTLRMALEDKIRLYNGYVETAGEVFLNNEEKRHDIVTEFIRVIKECHDLLNKVNNELFSRGCNV